MKTLIVIGLAAALTTGCTLSERNTAAGIVSGAIVGAAVGAATSPATGAAIGSAVGAAAIEANRGNDFSVQNVHHQKCDICATENAYYSRAVAQPSPCNDYPVEHRVQIPEADDRSRSVDRYIISRHITPVFSTAGFRCSNR